MALGSLASHDAGAEDTWSRWLWADKAQYIDFADHLNIDESGLVHHSNVGFNVDTGNAYLGGVSDPYEMLEACADRMFHIHAKDIELKQSEDERGKVTGTAVGCACGDGVIDWTRVVKILKDASFVGVLSVECGTVEQAEKSLKHLNKVIADQGA